MAASLVKELFVGAGVFTVGLLYFYALSLSVIVVHQNDMPLYFIAGGWALFAGVLYYEKLLDQKLKAGVI